MRTLHVVLATLLAGGAVAAAATVASAGTPVLLLPVQVTKVVEGVAPAGAEYVVDITCDRGLANPDQLVFDGGGSEIVDIPSGSSCAFTETGAGGATQTTTAAECTNPPQFCEVEVTGPTSANVSLLPPDSAMFDAEVVFVNTFEQPAPPAALPLELAPAFTG